MSGAQGGLLMVGGAVLLFVLWTRGYLAAWIGKVTVAMSGATVAQPIKNPLATTHAPGYWSGF